MGKFADLHLALEMRYQAFVESLDEENGDRLTKEIAAMIKGNDTILINGTESSEEEGKYDPSGYEGKDHRYYIHIYSAKLRFEEGIGTHPLMTEIRQLFEIMRTDDRLGGFSLNHTKEGGTILIPKEDVEKILKKNSSQNEEQQTSKMR